MAKIVAITGATGGLGMAMTTQFIAQGDYVYLLDLSQEAIDEAVKKLGDRATGLVVDVTNEESVEQAITHIVNTHGKLDVLVNNAGLQYRAKIEDFPVEKWRQLIDVMLTGTFLTTKYGLPHMKEARGGRIINISSIHGMMATPEKAAYVAAKHGVLGLTDVTGIEAAPYGITVNAVCPGPVKTPLLVKQLDDLERTEGLGEDEALKRIIYPKQAMERFIEPEEVASTVIYLASDAASGITMEHIKVAGGM